MNAIRMLSTVVLFVAAILLMGFGFRTVFHPITGLLNADHDVGVWQVFVNLFLLPVCGFLMTLWGFFLLLVGWSTSWK